MLDQRRTTRSTDRFLEVKLDLSDIIFIATTNVADTIPARYLDRMEVQDQRLHRGREGA